MSEQPKPCGFCYTQCYKDCDWSTLNSLQDLVLERDALRAALEMVEWVEADDHPDYCPWCGNFDNMGHTPDCPRQVALGLAESA